MTTALTGPERLLLRMPNWLGDAVMALPAAAALRTAFPATRIAIAAPSSIAPLFEENTIARQDEILAIARHEREVADLESGIVRHGAAVSEFDSAPRGTRARPGFPCGGATRWACGGCS